MMNYVIKPEEHELREAKQTVEQTLESCKYVLEKEEDLTISLGHAAEGDVGDFGVIGEAKSSDSAIIYFNADVDGWKDNLENMVADIYGQTWFQESSDIVFMWQQVLASMVGLMIIEELSEPKEVDIEEYKEEWAEKKTEISDEIFSDAQENLSWQLKTSIARRLLEEHELEDFPELSRTDVLDAGDSLFS